MRGLVAGVLAAVSIGFVPGVPAAECQTRELPNLAGVSVGVVSPPIGADDPYSWMLGASLFYERRVRVLGATWVLAARAEGYGQYARREPFGEAHTIWGGGSLGLEIAQRLHEEFALSLVPFAGAGFYWRRLEHDDAVYNSHRPIVLAGIALDLQLGVRLSAGVSVEAVGIMDRAPLAVIGQAARVGVRF